MRRLLFIVLIVIVLFIVDRLLLAAEARGWIYYRKRKGSRNTAPAAVLHMQAMLEPRTRSAAEQLRAEEQAVEDDEEGEAGPADLDGRPPPPGR